MTGLTHIPPNDYKLTPPVVVLNQTVNSFNNSQSSVKDVAVNVIHGNDKDSTFSQRFC